MIENLTDEETEVDIAERFYPYKTPQDQLEEICTICASKGHPPRTVHDTTCICGEKSRP